MDGPLIGRGRRGLTVFAALDPRRLPERAAGLCLLLAAVLLFGCAHAFLVPRHWLLALGGYLGSLALLVLRESRRAPREEDAPPSRRATFLAVALVGSVAVFMRTRYLDAVPIGFSDEVLGQFLAFSDRLVRKGLVYLPVYGYASTLHAYLAALAWKLFGSTFHVFRVYLAALGVTSCLAMAWWLKRLFGVREAVIGGVLLASSPWHQWTSRWGYPTPFIPLFTMLLCAALLALTTSPRKARWALAVAVIVTLGVHGHWGFTLEALAGALFIAFMAVTKRGFLRTHARALALVAASGALLLAPFAAFFLKDTDHSSYMRGHLGSEAVASGMSLGQKYAYNLKLCYCYYSASPGARALAEHSGGINRALAVAGGCGLLLCFVRARRSGAHAMMALFFLVNLAGLTITSALHVYATYLLMFWIGGAAVLWVEAWDAMDALLARKAARIVVAAACAAALAGAAAWDYRDYFYRYAYNVHGETARTGTYLLEQMRSAPRRGDVYLPRNEPGIDFDDAVLALADIGDYTFVRDAGAVRADTLFFPRSARAGRAAEVFVPAERFWADVFVPRLKAIYPHLRVRGIPIPRPWRSAGTPLLLDVEVPAGDLSVSRGLRAEHLRGGPAGYDKSSAEASVAAGYFLCDVPGAYLFSSAASAAISVGGQPVDGPVLLGQGAVAVQVRWSGGDEPGVSVRRVGDGGALADRLFHVPAAAEPLVAPCVAPRGVAARIVFTPERSNRLERFDFHRVHDALESVGRQICTFGGDTLMVVPEDPTGVRSYPLEARDMYSVEAAPDGRVWVFARGSDRVYLLGADGPPNPVKLGGANALYGLGFDSGRDLFAVGQNQVLVYTAGRWHAPVRVLGPLSPDALPGGGPVSAAVAPDGRVAVIDPVRRELAVLGPEGLRRRQLSGLWPGACVFFAGENWFVRLWPLTLLVFDRELRPLVPPGGETADAAWWSADPDVSLTESWGFHPTGDDGFSFFRRGELVTMRPQRR